MDTGPADLATQLSDVARELQRQPAPEQVLETVVRSALRLVPGTVEGSVSLVVGRQRVHSQAASSELPRRVDALQERVRQGPCLSAVFEHRTVLVDDLATESRWPEFSREAASLGVGSMLSFQLYVEGDNLGALNLYARQAGAFRAAASVDVGLLLASHAALAYAAAVREASLGRALGTRAVVGQAQGILMERHRITAEQALASLTEASQERNVKLHEVARRLVETGLLPAAG